MWKLRGMGLVLAVIATACGSTVVTPTTPTQTQTQTPTLTPTPPSALSPFVGVWDLTFRETELEDTGTSGCVAETMRSQMEVPIKILLTVTEAAMTISNPWGDYTCTYSDFSADSSGFHLDGHGSFVTSACTPPTLTFRCSDGTWHSNLWPWGVNLVGRLSGTELSGELGWDWTDLRDTNFFVGSFGEFTGTRR